MSVKRYSVNPFLDNLEIKKGTKTIKVNSCLGKDNDVIINQNTGEVKGTYIGTYRQVDESKFVKLFTQNVALTFNLTSAGIKAFNVLMFAMQQQAIDKDIVALDKFILEDFLNKNSLKLSLPTFSRGLTELVSAKIIARHSRQGFFFINPSFVFNGDRLVFSTVIERKRSAEPKNYQLEQEKE